MKKGLGKTLLGVLLAVPWFHKSWWFAVAIGVLCGTFVGHNAKSNHADMTNATVLVTGSSMGIGESVAYHFAKNGARIVITARSEEMMQKVAEKCRKLGASEVKYFVADMSNTADVSRLIEFVKQNFGDRLDYLVLNHILQKKAQYWQTESDEHEMSNLHKMYDVNVFSYIHLASALLPLLERQSGRLVVVSSLVTKHSFPFFIPYASSKAATESFFMGLRQELAMKSSGVTITLAILGRIDTPGQRRAVDTTFKWHKKFPSETAADTAEAIVVGANKRVREVYHPHWMAHPMTVLVNLPFVRPILEKVIQYQFQREATL